VPDWAAPLHHISIPQDEEDMVTVRKNHWLVIGCALALATFTTSCTRPTSTSPAALPSGVPVPTAVADISQLHLPIEAYLLTPAQSVESDWVDSAIIGTCMRRNGFNFPTRAKPVASDNAGQQYAVMYRRYGVTDPMSVRTWGYHVPQAPVSDDAAVDPTASGKLSSPMEQRVLTGTCESEANRALGEADAGLQGPGTRPGDFVSTIKQNSFTDSMADPRVVSVFARWSACMGSHGYHLRDPLSAPDNLTSLDGPAPSQAETAQAEADVACKSSTNLVGVWFAIESDYQNVAITKNAQALARIKAQRDQDAVRIQQLFATYDG
jgi:hypothetical protein